MDSVEQRTVLEALIAERGDSREALSVRLLKRNPIYLHQYFRTGSPRLLPERERGLLATYFGVPESALGGPESPSLAPVSRLDIDVSAGPGALSDSTARDTMLLDPTLLRQLGIRAADAAIVHVLGDSMEPTLADGDQVLVDTSRCTVPARGGIFVLRIDNALNVKRLRLGKGGIQVLSDNPGYEPYALPLGALDILGQVVWLSRTLV